MPKMTRFLLVMAIIALAACLRTQQKSLPEWKAFVSPSGSVRLERTGRSVGALEPALHEVGWRGASLAPAVPDAGGEVGSLRGQIRAPGGTVAVETRATPESGGVRLQYRLTPRVAMALNSLYVGM